MSVFTIRISHAVIDEAFGAGDAGDALYAPRHRVWCTVTTAALVLLCVEDDAAVFAASMLRDQPPRLLTLVFLSLCLDGQRWVRLGD